MHFIFSAAYLSEYGLSDIWKHGRGSVICYVNRNNLKVETDNIGTYQSLQGTCQETDRNDSVSYLSYLYRTYIGLPFITLTLVNKEGETRVYTLLKLQDQ